MSKIVFHLQPIFCADVLCHVCPFELGSRFDVASFYVSHVRRKDTKLLAWNEKNSLCQKNFVRLHAGDMTYGAQLIEISCNNDFFIVKKINCPHNDFTAINKTNF